MPRALHRHAGLSDPQRRAIGHAARERGLSLAGEPDLAMTHRYDIPEPAIIGTAYPSTLRPVTMRTKVEITGASPNGLIFEFGGATIGAAAWFDAGVLLFRAGEAAAADRALCSYTPAVAFPVGQRMDLQFSAIPGDGRARIWLNGKEVARDTASSGSFLGGWAGLTDGSFVSAPNGTVPADVTQPVAPTDFVAVHPLEVYDRQKPRHFV